MNNFYTLIRLKKFLNEKITGGIFSFAISPHKDVLECYFETHQDTRRLIFSTNANETALFLDKYRPPKKSNIIEFFKLLKGYKVDSVELADKDRILYIRFDGELFLLFRMFGGNPNCFLTDGDTVIDAFKNPENVRGESPPHPHAPVFAEKVSAGAKPKNQITRLNPLLPRNLLPYLIEQHKVDEMNPEEVKNFTRSITEALEKRPHPRVLKTGEVCLWSEELLNQPTEKVFNTVNEAVLYAYKNAVHLRRLHKKREGILQLLQRIISQKKNQLKKLKQADKSLKRADEYEKFGHLLMANAHRAVDDYRTDQIEVVDFYEDNKPLQIPLKKGLSVAENAEYYYDKAKSSRRSYEQARRRIPSVKEEMDRAERLLGELTEITRLPELEKWTKHNSSALAALGYGTEEQTQAVSPFRKLNIGKYEVWIGKNARSNDELLSRTHKEDIWLHARGVGGSHVAIRMGNQKSYPPKDIILRAASHAAFYSKARGMKTAPVMYTKRKYVRKPKGAAAGAVVVEREQVEMVPPVKPQKDSYY